MGAKKQFPIKFNAVLLIITGQFRDKPESELATCLRACLPKSVTAYKPRMVWMSYDRVDSALSNEVIMVYKNFAPHLKNPKWVIGGSTINDSKQMLRSQAIRGSWITAEELIRLHIKLHTKEKGKHASRAKKS